MLRLRSTDGRVWNLPDGVTFVEICNDEGDLVAVVHKMGAKKVALYSAGDENFDRYIKTYKLTKSQIIEI